MRGTVRIGWVLVAVAAIGAGCSSSDAGEVSATTVESSTTEVVTTSEATTSTTLAETTTTLSPEQIAEAEIEAVIRAWWTRSYDTSEGLDEVSASALVDPIRQRIVDLVATRTAAGEVQRSTGVASIEVVDISVDPLVGDAVATICAAGGAELVDSDSGAVLSADDGAAWDGYFEMVATPEGWRIADFFSGRVNGGSECELQS